MKHLVTIIWLKYCPYGVKHYIINQSRTSAPENMKFKIFEEDVYRRRKTHSGQRTPHSNKSSEVSLFQWTPASARLLSTEQKLWHHFLLFSRRMLASACSHERSTELLKLWIVSHNKRWCCNLSCSLNTSIIYFPFMINNFEALYITSLGYCFLAFSDD